MPAFLISFGGWIMGGLIAIAPTIVGQILISLGVGVATYTGLSATIDFLKDGIISAATGLPPEILIILSLTKVGSSLSIVFSAMVIRMTLQAVTGSTFKRWIKT